MPLYVRVSKLSLACGSGKKPARGSAEPVGTAWSRSLVRSYDDIHRSLDEGNRADLELRAAAIESRGSLRAQARRQAAEDWAQALHDRIAGWLADCGSRRPGCGP